MLLVSVSMSAPNPAAAILPRNRTPQTPTIAPPMRRMRIETLLAASRLHTHARLNRTERIGGDTVDFRVFPAIAAVVVAVDAQVSAVRVLAAEVEQVDAGEDGEEAAEEGDGVDGVAGVEAAEEDEGGDEGAGGEGDVVEGVDSAKLPC